MPAFNPLELNPGRFTDYAFTLGPDQPMNNSRRQHGGMCTRNRWDDELKLQSCLGAGSVRRPRRPMSFY